MPCDVKPDDITAWEIAEIQLAENHARKDLTPIEPAQAFADVIAKNDSTARDLAKRVGVKETHERTQTPDVHHGLTQLSLTGCAPTEPASVSPGTQP